MSKRLRSKCKTRRLEIDKRRRADAGHDFDSQADLAQADWEGECEVCGAKPVVPETGLCGPCTFGEATTVNGNW